MAEAPGDGGCFAIFDHFNLEVAALAVGSGAIALNQGDLGLAQGCGFAQLASGKVFVKLFHEFAGAAVIDLPERGDRGFGPTGLELVAESEDFFAIGAEVATEAGFAGAEDDEIKVIQAPAFDVAEGGVGGGTEEDKGAFDFFGDEAGVGGEVEDVVVAEFGADVGEAEVVAVEDAGAGLEGLDGLDFVAGVGETAEAKFVAAEGDRGGAVADRASEDFGNMGRWGGEIGEGLGGDVVDGVAFDEPLGAIVEGGEGDVAQLGVGGVDQGLGVAGFEVGFEGFDQPVVEFLGDRFGVLGGVLEGGAEVFDGGVEIGAFDVDGAAQGWSVGGGDDQFEAIVENEGINQDGVEFFEVIAEGVETAGIDGLAEDFGGEGCEEFLDVGTIEELIKLLIEFFLQFDQAIDFLLLRLCP